jgi:hypothetical protein
MFNGKYAAYTPAVRIATKKSLFFLLIGIVAISLVGLLVAEASGRISRRRAERLLHGLRQLQVGKSTVEDARGLIVGFGGGNAPYDHSGCTAKHCTFEVVLRHNPPLVRLWGPWMFNGDATWRVVHIFPSFGLQDWHAGATVSVDGGFVTQSRYGVLVRGKDGGVLGREIEEFSALPEYRRDDMTRRSYRVSPFIITTLGGGRGIRSSLTTGATLEERNRAYDVNFDCLTRLRGCSSLDQFAPKSASDLVRERNYIGSPHP